MQIISCCENEELVIDDRIFVTVLDIKEDHVRLGLSSEDNIPSYWEQTLYWEPSEQRQLQYN